jgi:Right handed beta helix region
MRLAMLVRSRVALAAVALAVAAGGVEIGWLLSADPAAESPAVAGPPSTTATVTPTPSAPTPSAKPSKPRPRPAPPLPRVGSLYPRPPKPSASPEPATPAPGGWPGAGNTGWRHTGVSLTPFSCSGGVTEITRSGTVIDGKDIRCGLLIRADNVTVRRSRVVTATEIPIRTEDGRRGARIIDTEIDGSPGGCIAAIGYEGWTAIRVDIHGCGDGVRIETGSTLQDSWIHDFWDGTVNGQQVDDPHHDGAQSTGGSGMTIRHNRIDNPKDQTSCILIGGEFGAPSNVLIENNYLNGGNYSIYLDPKGSNRVIRNNVFTRNHVYGPLRLEGTYTFTGNRYTDGAPVTP